MTVLFGKFRDIALDPPQGRVTITSRRNRIANGDEPSVILAKPVPVPLVDGEFRSDELDPGPVDVRVHGPGITGHWQIDLPLDGEHDLYSLIDLGVEYAPPAIRQAQAAAEAAYGAAMSATDDRRRVEQVLEQIEYIDPPSGWSDLRGKPDTFPPSAHRHTWGHLDGVPGVFPPGTHDHTSAEISDATSSATPNTIPRRDGGGRIAVPDPTASSHAVSRGWVEGAISAAIAAIVDGAPEELDTLKEIADLLAKRGDMYTTLVESIALKLNSADAVYSADSGASVVRRNSAGQIEVPSAPDAAGNAVARSWVEQQIAGTAAATANALARRDGAGRVSVGAPTSNDHATTKQYVDQAIASVDTAVRAVVSALTDRVATLEQQYSNLHNAFQNHASVAVISDNIRRITAADNPPGTSPPPDTFSPFELTIVRGEGA